jgi:hypothetical protein
MIDRPQRHGFEAALTAPTALRLDRTPSAYKLQCLFGTIIPAWLHDSRPQTIAIMRPEAVEIERVLRFGGRAMLKASCETELAEIRNSTSLRMTAPLRAAVTSARHFTSIFKARRNGQATDGCAPVLGRSLVLKARSRRVLTHNHRDAQVSLPCADLRLSRRNPKPHLPLAHVSKAFPSSGKRNSGRAVA